MAKVYMRTGGRVFTTATPEYHGNAERLSAKEGKAALAEQSKRSLETLIEAGVTVYTLVRSEARSGMSRTLDVFVATKGRRLRNISALVGDVLGIRRNKAGALVITGAGEPHGAVLAMHLSRVIRDDGYVLNHERI